MILDPSIAPNMIIAQPKPVKKQQKQVKKEKGPVTKKQFTNIIAQDLIDYIVRSIKFQLPDGGIHKPMGWKSKTSWGVMYKVLANVPPTALAKNSYKHDIISLRWKYSKGTLMPDKGQLEFSNPIGMAHTAQLCLAMTPPKGVAKC